MSNQIIELEHLIDALQSLPGVGRKTATKWAIYIINKDENYVATFANRLLNAKQKIHLCHNCNNLAKDNLCEICKNEFRFHNQLCIVSSIDDLQRIEDSANYNGLYFVLNGEINIKNKNKDLPTFSNLFKLVSDNKEINEIIIATNFTAAGQLTAEKIFKIFHNFNVRIYRIGLGLPLNSSLDYADNETIKYAFINKCELKG